MLFLLKKFLSIKTFFGKDVMIKRSNVTRYEGFSVFSGRPTECFHHLLFGKGVRKLADDDLITIPLLHCEHNMSMNGVQYQIHDNPAAEKLSKIAGQLAYERLYLARMLEQCDNVGHQSYEDWLDEAREDFRRRYGESWL